MTTARIILSIAVLASLASPAYARRGERNGFTFGLSMRALDNRDSSLAGDDAYSSKDKQSSVDAVNPHMGWAFSDTFNIGLMGTFESSSLEERDVSADGGQEVRRTQESTLKGGGLYLRFLFAKYMYFEGGFGIYDRRISVDNQYVIPGDGDSFVGRRETYSIRGVGPGYQLGFGIEVPVTNGFYFTSAYIARILQLRDYNGDGDVGGKRARIQQREVAFGLSHYVN